MAATSLVFVMNATLVVPADTVSFIWTAWPFVLNQRFATITMTQVAFLFYFLRFHKRAVGRIMRVWISIIDVLFLLLNFTDLKRLGVMSSLHQSHTNCTYSGQIWLPEIKVLWLWFGTGRQVVSIETWVINVAVVWALGLTITALYLSSHCDAAWQISACHRILIVISDSHMISTLSLI